MSSPHANAIGAYLLPDSYIADDLQWQIPRVRTTLSKLFAKGFAKRFRDGRHIAICEYLKWNPIENPNVAKAALKQCEQIPFEDPAFEYVFKGLEQYRERFGGEWETVSKRFGQAYRNREREPESYPEPYPEPRPEPNPEPEPEHSRSLRGEVIVQTKLNFSNPEVTEAFEEWWQHYPNKVSKIGARKAFVRVVRTGVTLDELGAGAIAYAANCDPKFYRDPRKWLNEGNWADEHRVAERPRSGAASAQFGINAVLGRNFDE